MPWTNTSGQGYAPKTTRMRGRPTLPNRNSFYLSFLSLICFVLSFCIRRLRARGGRGPVRNRKSANRGRPRDPYTISLPRFSPLPPLVTISRTDDASCVA
ncbi:hypothetical protein M951_chr3200 (nucleomorph) [Lotharella oceanica]|uniref:Uncharacterized protein n=1 Tax=Lotharella oceanica TaxID=641309 RepID=A0A060DB38_9EUKA|nr:hypothetical protein M951_chr15 [Lotharella oceanica]AIB09705.1 hypothetical protein M951_chr1226 [Lotharella oceanica]AIB09708.1 hypothetical protein M951_chr25 [Lotharella oceanica]AIB09908.1 hypothetical protein M951_chr2216 [Lotharella oceanica]AIB09911.1 hypothetical protein M951_chr35 [Lotharella oceanica]